jgi:ABC-2 type transport system ATP-binding protein
MTRPLFLVYQPCASPMPKPIIDAINLTKQYGATIALDRLQFQVSAGEIFGLLGPNGAGKTTLLSILAGLLVPTSGEARILGRLAAADPELRRHIGVVPQDLAIYGELSARENLQFFGSLYRPGGRALEARVDEVLSAMGLADRADQRVETFSGGMKRRLNLGAALVHEPDLLLLDEPTAGVDPQSRNHLFEAIRRINASGATVVYTSHYMEEVQALCSRIGILDRGRLIACDTLPVLLQQLDGMIRFRVPHVSPALRERLKQIPGCRLTEADGPVLGLECRDVKGALLRVVAILNDMQLELISLETQEPNLERVFLHLTGRALRD